MARVLNLGTQKGDTTVTFTPQAPISVQSSGIGGKIMGAADAVTNFVGARGLAELGGAEMAKLGLSLTGNMEAAKYVQDPTMKEVLGSAVQTGANFIPGVGVGAKLATKVGAGAATGYAFDVGSKLQAGESLPEAFTPGAGTAIGAALPVAGAVAKPVLKGAMNVAGRLMSSIASGLSGVSKKAITSIVENPQTAKAVTAELKNTGGDALLEKNARTIVEGVSKIRREAGEAFGKGLGELKAQDIKPATFRASVQPFLDKWGVSVDGTTRYLRGVEFDDPKNLQKASNLIDDLSKTKLDGLSLRRILEKIDNAKYKTAVTDERLAYNAFIRELGDTVKEAIGKSTDKLSEINKAYSTDMQLAEAAQDIFGKVEFKNLSEVLDASKKLETLFAQKGLAPNVIDRFLKRIGVESSEFMTSEAVRQISNVQPRGNVPGLNLAELLQSITSAAVTPQTVKRIAELTGIASQNAPAFINAFREMTPTLQKALLNTIVQHQQESQK